MEAVERLRDAYPGTPILSRARSPLQLYKLGEAGATDVVPEQTEVSLRLGAVLLDDVFALSAFDVEEVSETVRASLRQRALQRGQQEAEEAAAPASKAAADSSVAGKQSTAEYMRQLLAGAKPEAGTAAGAPPVKSTAGYMRQLLAGSKPEAGVVAQSSGGGGSGGGGGPLTGGSSNNGQQQRKAEPQMTELDLIMGAAEDVSTGQAKEFKDKLANDKAVESVLAPARRPNVFSERPMPPVVADAANADAAAASSPSSAAPSSPPAPAPAPAAATSTSSYMVELLKTQGGAATATTAATTTATVLPPDAVPGVDFCAVEENLGYKEGKKQRTSVELSDVVDGVCEDGECSTD